MSLKDRIKSKKEAKISAAKTEYTISVNKVASAIAGMKNAEDLGNITREFAKFLNSLDAKNAKIVFTGEFDMGQKTLLNCILASFLEDDAVESAEDSTEDVLESKLIQKRRSLKSKISAKKNDEQE